MTIKEHQPEDFKTETIREFMKWCDDKCYEHQDQQIFALKHKDCRKCWDKVKEVNDL